MRYPLGSVIQNVNSSVFLELVFPCVGNLLRICTEFNVFLCWLVNFLFTIFYSLKNSRKYSHRITDLVECTWLWSIIFCRIQSCFHLRWLEVRRSHWKPVQSLIRKRIHRFVRSKLIHQMRKFRTSLRFHLRIRPLGR